MQREHRAYISCSHSLTVVDSSICMGVEFGDLGFCYRLVSLKHLTLLLGCIFYLYLLI